MLAARPDKTDNLRDPRAPFEERAARAWQATSRRVEDRRIAAAAVLLRAAERVVLTGTGIGRDAAAFGAVAFGEAGFDARSVHAADLASGAHIPAPGSVVIGIDTEGDATPEALARARALGLRTIALTDQELTRVESDVLVEYPSGITTAIDVSPISMCAALALLVARVEPDSRLAREAAGFHEQIARLSSAREPTRALAERLRGRHSRLVIAAAGRAAWVAEGIAARLNSAAEPVGGGVLPAHHSDVSSGAWRLRDTDTLITLDLDVPQMGRDPYVAGRTQPQWRIGGPSHPEHHQTRIPVESPALAALAAHVALELLLDELCAG